MNIHRTGKRVKSTQNSLSLSFPVQWTMKDKGGNMLGGG